MLFSLSPPTSLSSLSLLSLLSSLSPPVSPLSPLSLFSSLSPLLSLIFSLSLLPLFFSLSSLSSPVSTLPPLFSLSCLSSLSSLSLSPLSLPTLCAVPSSMFLQAPPVSLTNTREIGVKHRIELQRGTKGYGIGLTSRDVRTEERNQPVYVKAVHHDGPAYLDRRLQIGDRILEVGVLY